MQQAYVDINGVPTRVITYGRWIEESVPEDAPPDIVVCIPGNPGVTEFYIEFLQTLHEQLRFPVWIIGHAGHESPSKDSVRKMPPLKGNGQLYDLEGQIKHKYEFVSRYVPDNARIHFIGHSIGSYIILKLLPDLAIDHGAVASYFLFPAIEHMRDTPNGKFVNRFVRYIIPIILFFAWIFSLLPNSLQTLLVRVYINYYTVAPHHLKTICNFLKPETLAQVFHMAVDEMDQVHERDSRTVTIHKDRVKFYYGASDRWAPVRFCDGLKRDVPGIEAEVCQRNFEHAFVLRHSKEVALMVADWILERTSTFK